jgi:hypothetical protein
MKEVERGAKFESKRTHAAVASLRQVKTARAEALPVGQTAIKWPEDARTTHRVSDH